MPEYNEYFTPDQVDEQIEHFSSSLHSPQLPRPARSGGKLVQQLRLLYQEEADAASLSRVGERLQKREQALPIPDDEIVPAPNLGLPIRGERRERANQAHNRVRILRHTSRLSMIAAVVFLALLVSSMAIVLNLARSNREGTTHPGGNPADSTVTYTLVGDTIYKIDLKRGAIVWSKSFPSASYAGRKIAVSNDLVYFSMSQGPEYAQVPSIYALRASDGSQVWRTPLDPGLITAQIPQPSPPGGVFTARFDLGFTTQPIVANGLVFVAARTGKVYALDAATGSRRWTYNTHLNAVKCVGEAGQKNYNCFFTTEPTVWTVENGVVYGTIQNEIYALDAANGSKRWATTLDSSQVAAGKLAYSNGALYAITNDIATFTNGTAPQYSYLYAFDTRTGIKQWATNRFTGLSIGPEVLNQIVYVGTQDGSVYAFNGNSGSLLRQKSFGPSDSLAFAVDNQTLYIQTNKLGPSQVGQHTPVTTTLFALSATDGVLRWHSRIDRNGWADEVLSVSNGVIYVLTEVESNSAGQHSSLHLFLDAYDAPNGHRLWSKPL